MSNMLGFLSDIGDIIKIGIILAVVILLMVLLLKFKNGKWILAGVMAVALVVCGVFTSFANYTYFTIEGGTFGSFGDIFANKNKVTQKDLSFEFENFVLVSTGIDGEFSARLSIEAVDETLIGKAMYVNNSPTKLTGVGENYIFSEYSYIFKDENLTPMLTDTLTIKFVFNSKKSECLLSTSGGSDAVKYWNSYLKKNKFNVEIKEAEYERDDTMIVGNPTNYTVNLYVEDEIYKTYTVNVLNQGDYTLPFVINNYIVSSWQDEDGNIYSSSILPLANVNLYAELIYTSKSMVLSLNKETLPLMTTSYGFISEIEEDFASSSIVSVYNDDIFSLMNSSNSSDYEKLDIKCYLNFNNHNFGKVSTSTISFGEYIRSYYIIKNASNTKAYQIICEGLYNQETGTICFVFGSSLYSFSDEFYPTDGETDIVLTNEDFETFIKEIETSIKNCTFDANLNIVIYNSETTSNGMVIVDPNKPSQPTIGDT